MAYEFVETTLIELPNLSDSLLDYTESAVRERHKLIIEQAAIHEGLTANYNFYPGSELEKSLSSWMQPYPKPLLINHDTDVSPLGRVMAARMDKSAEGVPFVRLQIGVTDPEAVEKVLDQRYMTGSVGGKAGSAKCSICGTDWAQATGYNAPCKHQRGKVYSGKLAYFELSDLSFREYSFVNVPADQRSILITTATESEDFSRSSKVFSLDMEKESIVQYVEQEQPREVLSSMKKKDAHYTYTNLKGTWLAVSAYYDLDKTNENITNDVDVTTMSNEALSDDNKVSGYSDHAEENLMSKIENDEVTKDEEEESVDIAAVVEQLSDDLAQTVASEEETAEDVEVASEETETEDSVDEEILEPEATEQEDQPEENVDSSEGESDEVAEEAEEVVEGEVEELADEVDSTEESQETAPDERDALIEKLSNENKQLRAVMHKMLAERVIDKKIDLGIIPAKDRAEALQDHVGRSAASLADTLKDLHKLSPMVTTPLESIANLQQDTQGAFASGSEPVESFEESAPKEMPQVKAEKLFTDVLMGRHTL